MKIFSILNTYFNDKPNLYAYDHEKMNTEFEGVTQRSVLSKLEAARLRNQLPNEVSHPSECSSLISMIHNIMKDAN